MEKSTTNYVLMAEQEILAYLKVAFMKFSEFIIFIISEFYYSTLEVLPGVISMYY